MPAPQERNTGGARLRISVHDVDGRNYDQPADVRLVSDKETVSLEKAANTPFYEAVVPRGAYQLQVTAGQLVAPEQALEIGDEEKRLAVYLGEKGWPYYRLGQHLVPFAPPGGVIAVAFPSRAPDDETRERIVSQITERLPLERCPLSQARREQQGNAVRHRGEREEPEAADYAIANGSIWLFRFTERADAERRQQAAAIIQRLAGEHARVGIPVDLNLNQVTVMDNRFVVRFANNVEGGQIEDIVRKAGGRILRSAFAQAANMRLIELPGQDFGQHLAIIESWYEQGLLLYGEPDLMAEIVDDQFPQSPPNDPTYANQQNLTLQRIDEAWQTLHNADENLSLGNPDIYVASLDRGVQIDHPDVNGNLTDGTPQIANCFDFSNMRPCTAPGYAPFNDHGMGVYGIIAARTNNQTAVAGIAPNTHQIGMERPDLTSVNYPDVLLWAAGFTTGNTDPDWPDEPLTPGAAIINCSHGRNGLALSGIMDDTFKTLTDNGRDGLGTIVVYSAGNDDEVITGFRTWAAHSRTLAIANSRQPNNAGVETKANSSNYGPEIDVCAQGVGAPSLDDNGGEQNFGGTSAAAPTVAAVAALMLSLVPTLRWDIVRNILRETAVKIDPQNNDPAGRWEDKEGRTVNHPSYSGPHFSQWYGYGRIDAQEAVSYFSGCADAFTEFIKKLLSGKWN